MTNSAEVYTALNELIDDSFHFDVSVHHTTDSKGNSLFILYGRVGGDGEYNTLQKLGEFVSKYNPDSIEVGSAVKGGHIKFKFNADRISGAPEKQTSYDRIVPREAESGSVRECTNCRASTYGLHRPPITLRFPADEFSSPTEEIHDLCVDCSPGHFDDVTRRVEYFGIRDGEVSIVAFDNHEGIEEFAYEEVDNPYVESVVEVINTKILPERN